MFGHQDEPQKPATSPFTAPDPTADGSLDDGLNDIVTSTAPGAPATPPTDTPAASEDSSLALPEPSAESSVAAPSVDGPVDTNTLLDIKQQALQQLSPLVSHLDQSPEDKFRTTMMMIQAADNQDLIATAYAAAQAINDEKARAQALLDLVNEINYFTQRQAK